MSLQTIVLVAAIVHVGATILTTLYAADWGHPWLPVLLATLFLGFPLPLLLIALSPKGFMR